MKRAAAVLITLFHGLIGLTHIAAGQGQSDSVMVARETPRWTTGSINVQLGAARLGLNELNRTMTANDRPAFAQDVVTIGLSGYARFGRLVLGGSGESALPQRKLSPGWVNRVSFGSAMVDAGMALVDGPLLVVYPQVSIGLRHTALRIEQRGDFTYDGGVGSPARGVTLSSWSALGGVGVVAELRLHTRVTGAFSVGMRAGYASPLGNASSSAGESQVAGAPRETSGGYLRLSLGKPIGKRGDVVSALSTALASFLTP